jgi:hypothetical protein
MGGALADLRGHDSTYPPCHLNGIPVSCFIKSDDLQEVAGKQWWAVLR